MMRTFITLLFLSVLFISKADGLEAALEINYTYQNEKAKGYIEADYFYGLLDSLVGNDETFMRHFKEAYKGENEILIYSELVDQEELKNAATFPMLSYLLVKSTGQKFKLSELSEISVTKVWKRSAYSIEVKTPIYLTDLEWISKPSERLNLGWDDVGCRLDLYCFESYDENDPLIQELYSFSNNDGMRIVLNNSLKLERFLNIIYALKKQKIVVVEACGC